MRTLISSLLIVGLLIGGCSSIKKMLSSQEAIHIIGTAQKVLVHGCLDLPEVEATYAAIAPLLPADATIKSIQAGYVVSADIANKVCAEVMKKK